MAVGGFFGGRGRKTSKSTSRRESSRSIFLILLAFLVIEHFLLAIHYVWTSSHDTVGDSVTVIAKSREAVDPKRGIGFSHKQKSLHEITQTGKDKSCPSNLVFFRDVYRPSSHSTVSRRIPKIVHQTSKSRCVTDAFAQTMKSWEFDGWSHYLHDDEAIARLFQSEVETFPLLATVAEKCLLHGTMKSDLWRYLVLWVYGGFYADMDSIPNKLTPEDILPEYDGLFVVEQYHMLSQYFMGMSPRHPLMWYAVNDALANLLIASDTGSIRIPFVTGPHALHRAYRLFRKDAGAYVDPEGTGYKPVWKGTFFGTHNRSVTVLGIGENQNEFVNRDVLNVLKKREYKKMNMRHFHQEQKIASGVACLQAILQMYYEQMSAP